MEPICYFVGQKRTCVFAAGTAVGSDVCPYLCGLRMAADDLSGRTVGILWGLTAGMSWLASQESALFCWTSHRDRSPGEEQKEKNIMKPIDAVQNGIECKQSADCFLPTKKRRPSVCWWIARFHPSAAWSGSDPPNLLLTHFPFLKSFKCGDSARAWLDLNFKWSWWTRDNVFPKSKFTNEADV